jgi:hypothetical protein
MVLLRRCVQRRHRHRLGGGESSPSKSSLSVSEVCVVIGHTAVGGGDLLALISHSYYTSDLPVLTRRSY